MSAPMSQDEEETLRLRRRISLSVQQAMDSVAEGLLQEMLKGKHTREEMTAAIQGSDIWGLEDTWIEALEELDRDQEDPDD